jgi:hypothetical protein
MAMPAMGGFLGWLGVGIGHKLFTITAWENAESAHKLLNEETHQEALRRFFGSDFWNAVGTGIWLPERLNTTWVRCKACGTLGRVGG